MWQFISPRECVFFFPASGLSFFAAGGARRVPLQVSVLLVGYVLLQQVVDGDDPAVVELSVHRHLLLLHLRLHLHHLQRGVIVVAVLHRVQLLRQVLLRR